MNKLIISIFTLLMVAVGAMAQTATVTGTVTDDYGPVIGATVIVQGTTLGCMYYGFGWQIHIDKRS